MPYGLHLAPWDVLLTDEEFELFFNMIAVINHAKKHTLFLHTHPKDVGRVWAKMEENNYQHVHQIFVYKPIHNTKGTHQYLNAVDQILVGYQPTRNDAKPLFESHNPLLRHNLLYSQIVKARTVMAAGGSHEPLNITEKHPVVAMQLGKIHAHPGDRALVVGAGSGSEVIGFNRAGLNVVAIELDRNQFNGIRARVMAEAANEMEADEEAELQLKQIKEHRQATTQFEKAEVLPKEKNVKSGAPATKRLKTGTSPEPDAVSASSAAPQTCVACGSGPGEDRLIECSSRDCGNAVFHSTCMSACETCGEYFCGDTCSFNHKCEVSPKHVLAQPVEAPKVTRSSLRISVSQAATGSPKKPNKKSK